VTVCGYCTGQCRGADMVPLLTEELQWLWDALAAAGDRRGDPDLTTGHLDVTAPTTSVERAAAVGLLGGTPLRAGQRRRVDLPALTDRLHVRGSALTPGAVAAHALCRRLATRRAVRHVLEQRVEQIRSVLERQITDLPAAVRDRFPLATAWERLRTTGWITRLAAQADPATLIAHAVAIVGRLPEPDTRVDRRTLVTNRPHALDDGTPLAGLVLALAGLSGGRARTSWHSLGVDCDDLTGGLHMLGIHPRGWALPPDVVVTVPPRELRRCSWPVPPHVGMTVFVTENPSIVSAAAARAAQSGAGIRLVGTSGTPSSLEIDAIAALPGAGWSVAVRADFDVAGLAHVRRILSACPRAKPWRMGAADYMTSLARDESAVDEDEPMGHVTERDTPWDPLLARVMVETGKPAYEEALLAELLDDMTWTRRRPRSLRRSL